MCNYADIYYVRGQQTNKATIKKMKPSHSKLDGLMLFLFTPVTTDIKHNLKVLGWEKGSYTAGLDVLTIPHTDP